MKQEKTAVHGNTEEKTGSTRLTLEGEEGLKLIIENVLKTLGPEVSEEEKKKQKEILLQVFGQGMTPRKAMGFSDETVEAIYAGGYRYYNAGSYENAMKLFSALCILETKDPRFPFGVAACLQKLGDLRQAIEAYYSASLLDPFNPLPTFYMYYCYRTLDDHFGAYATINATVNRLKAEPNPNEALKKMLARCEILMKSLAQGHPEVLEEMQALEEAQNKPVDEGEEALKEMLKDEFDIADEE